jgi:drug/metabolite transporter (DMT)-like permease
LNGARGELGPNRTATDWILLAALVVIWGSSFAATKIAVETIPAEWISAGRLSIAAALLVPLVLVRGGNFAQAFRNRGWIVWLTLAGTVVPFFLIAWGTRQITSGLAGVLMAIVPLMILVFAHLMLPDERLTWPKALGFGLGFAGVVVLIGPDTLLSLGSAGLAFWGQMAIIGATVCYGLHTTTARLVPTMASQELATATLALGAVIALPIALVISPEGLMQASARSMLALLVLGTFQTAIASLVLYRLIAQAGASFTAMCNYLIPLFAVVLGAVWLDEALTPSIVIGCALVLGGIAVSQQIYRSLFRRPRREVP